MRKKQLYLILIPIVCVLGAWSAYMITSNKWNLFVENWFMSLTMMFGSFIAGASSEGGGAVAFPVMTLIFNISPEVARNFSLAIQSIGMTTASYLIIVNKIKTEYKYLWLVSFGGIFGMILGTIYLVPLISPPYAKMLFVTLWLSFGIILYYANEIQKRKTIDALPKFNLTENISIIIVGLFGGAISSFLGSGIDIFSFSYVTMRYSLSEKIATPTSVVIMAFNSIVGFVMHFFIINDFGTAEFNYWMVCIPVVVIGAPLGAYLINKKTRGFISKFLYLVILVQFIGALIIINPAKELLIFSGLVFISGLALFFTFNWLSKKHKSAI